MQLRTLLTATMIACLAFTGCGDDEKAGQPSGAGTPDEVTGPIVDIDSEGLGHVRSFSVRSGEETYEILIDNRVDYGFPLGHLNEHRISGAPVRVELEERNGDLYAQAIIDA